MPYKIKEENRAYQREWTRRKRLGLPTKGIRQRELLLPEEKRRRKNVGRRKLRAKNKERAFSILGDTCFFCGGRRNLVFHEKNGVTHRGTPASSLVLKNPESFVVLCKYPCHTGIHFCMEYLRMSWDDIVEYLADSRITGVRVSPPAPRSSGALVSLKR